MANIRRISYRKKSKLLRSFKFYSFIILALILVSGSYYAVAYSNIFKVQSVEVNSNLDYITREVIIEAAERAMSDTFFGRSLGTDNVLTWSPSLALVHPLIRDFSIDRQLGKRTITISVSERERLGIWCFTPLGEPEVCYWFDREGVLLERSPQTSGALITQVKDTEPVVPLEGDLIEPKEFFNYTLKILDELNGRNLRFQSFVLDRIRQEFRAQTDTNTDVAFSLRFEPTQNIFDFLESLRDTGQLDTLQYLDLTVENRIYTKE